MSFTPDGVLILGAGLTGLSLAHHLGGGKILEKEAEVGGLCRSYLREGFTFDFTGHLLHLKDGGVRELLERLAPGAYASHRRRARIHTHGRLTPYPFQLNLRGLPPEVVTECLEGLRRAEEARGSSPPGGDDFRTWVLRTFGEGIARHFMLPYNRKIWDTPPERMTADWVAGLVPLPSYQEALRGVREEIPAGYNASFLYPAAGGISLLPRSFLPTVPRIHLGREAVEIDPRRRVVVTAQGDRHHYRTLASTIPLPSLLAMMRGVPARVARAAGRLSWVSVWDLNLGVARDDLPDAHWIYFPGEEFPFYRVGFPHRFSPTLVPPGCGSMYVETSHRPHRPLSAGRVVEESLAGLRRAGILAPGEVPLVVDPVHIPCGYVIFDRHRREALPVILEWLRERDVHSVGRYGAWRYDAMEEAILEGRRLAGLLRGEG
jgi:protoporphyrinogen oxidase